MEIQKKLTESLDICIFNIGPFNWIVLSNWKSSNDQRQIVVSWLDETKTSLALLTWSAVTGPLWCFIFTTWREKCYNFEFCPKKCLLVWPGVLQIWALQPGSIFLLRNGLILFYIRYHERFAPNSLSIDFIIMGAITSQKLSINKSNQQHIRLQRIIITEPSYYMIKIYHIIRFVI